MSSGRAFGSVVERVVRILEVVGSIPTMSTSFARGNVLQQGITIVKNRGALSCMYLTNSRYHFRTETN